MGNTSPLYSVNAQTISVIDGATSNIGSIAFKDGVTTYTDQTYRANATISQSSSPAGGDVVFAVYDPSAYMTFFLPLQTSANSGCTNNCGQVNMQDATGGNTLVFKGNSRFVYETPVNGVATPNTVDWRSIQANTTGDANWGPRTVLTTALGYAPPLLIPAMPPVIQDIPLPQQPIVNAAVLRELMDNYVQYTQIALAKNGSVVTVSSPEEVTLISGKPKGKKTPDDADGSSDPTQSREVGIACGADKDGKVTSCVEE